MDRGPTLFLVATPIGHLGDVTYRAVETLGAVGALACEDTRVTRRLLERYGIARPATMFSCHEHNEDRAARRVLGLLERGESVAYCSDAGTPGISDPGFLLVRAALDAGHNVEVIPGPSAVVGALVISGLPTHAFAFLGFPPRKGGARRRMLDRLRPFPDTLVFYESPHRIGAFLEDALEVLGDRRAAVAVELTKLYEGIDRRWLSELAADHAGRRVRGEITVVVAGDNPKFRRDAPADQSGSCTEST